MITGYKINDIATVNGIVFILAIDDNLNYMVIRSNDYGNTWKSFSSGLPTSIIAPNYYESSYSTLSITKDSLWISGNMDTVLVRPLNDDFTSDD